MPCRSCPRLDGPGAAIGQEGGGYGAMPSWTVAAPCNHLEIGAEICREIGEGERRGVAGPTQT
jgi:hypothetical protein